MDSEHINIYKILIIGESYSRKTCIILPFVVNKYFKKSLIYNRFRFQSKDIKYK